MPPNAIRKIIERAEPFALDWAEPDMGVLSDDRRPAPPLPLTIFGEWQPWITDTAEGTSSPPDYCAWGLLAVAAALVGNARLVSPWPDWKEPPILWMGLIGPPSSGKSPAVNSIVGLLRELEFEAAEDFDATRRQYLTEKEAAACVRSKWESEVKEAMTKGTPAPTMPAGAEPPEEPSRPRLIVSDTTPEALGAILAGQPKGLLMWRDELAGWLANFDRYSGNGGERAFWLECTGGRPYAIDRVKHAGKPLQIPRLTVGVLGGIQPDRLSSLFLSGDDDGLLARFLLTWPEPVEPTRPVRQADNVAALNALRRLQGLAMTVSDGGKLEPMIVTLAEDAIGIFQEYREECYADAKAVTGRFGSHLGKLPGLVLRLSLVLEFLWWAWRGEGAPPAIVTARAVALAVSLAKGYLVPMAERVYGDAAMPESQRLTGTLARWIVRTKARSINTRELSRNVRLPGLGKAEPIREACAALVEAGWLKPKPTRSGGTAGRTRNDYLVNPKVTGRG
jgi:putative DNA primase/helicase